MRVAVMLTMVVLSALPATAKAQAAAQGAVSANATLQTSAARPALVQTAQKLATARADLAALDREIAALRAGKDSTSDMAEVNQLRLQMLMERRAKAFQTISNLLKKNSETSGAIVGNLK